MAIFSVNEIQTFFKGFLNPHMLASDQYQGQQLLWLYHTYYAY